MSPDQDLLPAAAGRLAEQLATALCVDRLRVFGGAALDLLANPSAACHDVDVALSTVCRGRFAPDSDVTTVGDVRSYWIRLNVPVTMIMCRWQDTLVDVNFLDEMDKIGHFDIERVWWDYPDRTFTDQYSVAFKPVRTFHLVTAPDDDNPLLLLNRIVNLAAKYDVPFWRQQHLRELVAHLVTAVRCWTPPTEFHGPVAHEAHLRAIASSVRRARRPATFLAGCLDAGVLDACLQPLAQALRRDSSVVARLADGAAPALFWATADAIVTDRSAAWRRYRRETSCDSGS